MPIVHGLIGIYCLLVGITAWRIIRLHNESGLPLTWVFFSLLWPIQLKVLPYLLNLASNRPQPQSRQDVQPAQTFMPWLLVSFPLNIGESKQSIKILHWLDTDQKYWLVSESIKQIPSRQYISIPISYNERKQWACLSFETKKGVWELLDLKAPVLLVDNRNLGQSFKLSTPPEQHIPLIEGTRWVLHNSEFELMHLKEIYAIDLHGIARIIVLGKRCALEFDDMGKWEIYGEKDKPPLGATNLPNRLVFTSDLRIRNLEKTNARLVTPWIDSIDNRDAHIIPGSKLYLNEHFYIRFTSSLAIDGIDS